MSGDPVDIEVGQGTREEGLDVMHLIPHEGWWVAAWWELSGTRQITIDVCTPPELSSAEWKYVDLELDPYWTSKGAAGIADRDEFEAECDSGIISPSEAAASRQAAADLLACLKDGIEPFGKEGWSRYENAIALDLAPLRDLPPLWPHNKALHPTSPAGG
ncbi:MAG TPA: DUF402 domain-containing protein [Actinomycetota bacterium]|nr:DUF402 domain-containing protein [Actinomycetota bacterium]